MRNITMASAKSSGVPRWLRRVPRLAAGSTEQAATIEQRLSGRVSRQARKTPYCPCSPRPRAGRPGCSEQQRPCASSQSHEQVGCGLGQLSVTKAIEDIAFQTNVQPQRGGGGRPGGNAGRALPWPTSAKPGRQSAEPPTTAQLIQNAVSSVTRAASSVAAILARCMPAPIG